MKKNQRQIIITKAAKLFRQKGYTATTMRDLAKEVGMEAASLYNHIASKQEILSILMLNIAQEFTKGIDEIQSNTELNPIQQLEALISLHINITIDNQDASALLTHEWRHLEGDTYIQFNQSRKAYEQSFKKILVEGIENNYIKDVDPDIALFSILSTMRWLYAWYNKNADVNRTFLHEQFKKTLIQGIIL